MKRAAPTSTKGEPLIIGHRGASADAPENTLAAFARALEDGADGVEFDVRLARDGVAVCVHDATLARTGLRPERVAALTSAELRRVDAGTWFNRRFPRRARAAYAREAVPTLAEALELVGPRSQVVYVEMKCEEAGDYPRLAREVVNTVRELGLADRAVVKSFEHAAVAEAKLLAPEIRAAALFDLKWSRPAVTAREAVARTLACGAEEVSLHRSLLRPAVVEAARRHGLETIIWTADTPAWLERAVRLGLRAVITNRPAEMRAALAEIVSSCGFRVSS
ncbi:MAG TPA: glycerophosphodiester phosphodiesterase family protein [Pyrinomonadaceae bacterium]|nr:glycerophosphodiester phosphodiesterase family protein [Pyrinomonadaceae bacterium]